MPTMYDLVRRRAFETPPIIWNVLTPSERANWERWVTQILEDMRDTQVISLDNVGAYYWESEKMLWEESDFPNIAPVFPSFWMEYRLPPALNLKETGLIKRDSHMPRRVGALIRSTADTELGSGWLMVATMFLEGLTGVYGPIGGYMWRVNGQGQARGNRMVLAPKSDMARVQFSTGPAAVVNQDTILQKCQEMADPFLLALSFLHCKNVNSVENVPPDKLSKAYQKRHGYPLIRYYTLEIDPMKEVLRREGRSDEVGLKKALHICRGHFKDYREKGLFGKYKGMFWWEAHVRGTIQQGAVVKDYAVKAPK